MKLAFHSLKLSALVSVAITATALAIGCSSASGPSLNPAKSDCNTFCSKQQECINKDANVQSCTDKCTAKSDNDGVFRAKVKECADCAEPKACSEVSSCTGDCLKVLLD